MMRTSANAAFFLGLCALASAGQAAAQSVPPASAATPDQLLQAALRTHAAGDLQGALDILRPVAYRGHREAQFTLGRLLESGARPTRPQYTEAANWYYRAAQAGHTGAMNNLAALHVDGLGVPVTYSVALRWYTAAANAGFAPAQYNLALMHGRGQGTPRDEARMLSWLQKAAGAGYDRAQAQLGRMLLEGAGSAKAVEWFRLAASQGNPEAQYHLGLQLLNGRADEAAEGLELLRKAAAQGHALAAWEAGRALEAGMGGKEDGEQARLHYRMAAMGEHIPAMERMRRLYREGGLGQPANASLAAFWEGKLKMAAAATNNKGKAF